MRTLPFSLIALTCIAASAPAAEFTWDGGGADRYWNTPANWAGDGSSPASTGGDAVVFYDLGGGTNVLDRDYAITTLLFSNKTGTAHTVDLDGRTLTIVGANGGIRAGYAISNATAPSIAAIRNGTLRLGGNSGVFVRSGEGAGVSNNTALGHLTLGGRVEFTNVTLLAAGYAASSTIRPCTGLLDLAQAVILSPNGSNTLKAGILYAGRDGASSYGEIRLPPELESVELTSDCVIGYGLNSIGILDFGAGSRLTNFTVGGHFYLGGGGPGILTNWPVTNVTLQVGKPALPRNLYVGYGGSKTAGFGQLVISNGTLNAWLADFLLGGQVASGTGYGGTGIVDLAAATVQIGNEPNKIKGCNIGVGSTSVGGTGLLRLPSAITDLQVGFLRIGSGGSSWGLLDLGTDSMLTSIVCEADFRLGGGGYGELIIGSNGSSRLQAFTVNGDFILGCGAEAVIRGWPTNIPITIGTPENPSRFQVAYSIIKDPVETTFAPTGGSFRAYLKELSTGGQDVTSGQAGHQVGVVDLTETAVQIGDEPDQVKLDLLRIGYSQAMGKGTLRLPAAVTALDVGDLFLGRGLQTYGILDFGVNSSLRTLTVTNSLYVGTDRSYLGRFDNFPTGVTVRLGSAAKAIPVILGDVHQDTSAGGVFEVSNGTVSAWVSDLRIGINRRDLSGSVTGRLNIVNSTLGAFTVTGDAVIGCYTNELAGYRLNRGGRGYLGLPAGDAAFKGALFLGDSLGISPLSSGVLDLRGTRVAIEGALQVNDTGRITNQVNGVAGGLDIAATATGRVTFAAGGNMHLVFAADPTSLRTDYWGLRMAGDQRTFLAGLQDAGNLTWDLAGLSERNRQRFGIHYLQAADQTIVGIERAHSGALIQLR